MRLARDAAKVAIGGALAAALVMVGGTAAMAEDGTVLEPSPPQSVEVVPGEAVTIEPVKSFV